MFGEAAARHMSDEVHRVAVRLEDARHRGDLGHAAGRFIVRTLVGDDDTERRVILRGQTRQGNG